MQKVAILVYGEQGSNRNALAEEKYQLFAETLTANNFSVRSVLYNDGASAELSKRLTDFDAVLVWVNPIEKGNDRTKLDAMLREIFSKGCFVSAHPDVILKMGAKDVLFKTLEMSWSCDTKMYIRFEQFKYLFPNSLNAFGTRILKQYRGNGGNGVFMIRQAEGEKISVIHAASANEEKILSLNDFLKEFQPFFLNEGMLIDQEWNGNTINGMVRCYVAGKKVAGFGYQEINALYELNEDPARHYVPPSKRYYFTENCGLFSDLRKKMEEAWIPELQMRLGIDDKMMPVIWDADFFINNIASEAAEKYTLCEINVSCVSPFPPSAVKYMVDLLRS
jgi:hypothetical protein